MHQEPQHPQHCQHPQQLQQQQQLQQPRQQCQQRQRTPTGQVIAQLATVGALLLSAALVGTAPVLAAPQQRAQDARLARAPAVLATSLASKVVLPETSIDGPALSSVITLTQGQNFNRSVIGWTGTDAAHHLNVENSGDGLHFGNKRTLGETSPFRPDVTQIGQPEGGFVTVAWTGTDANHSLNVLTDVFGTSQKKLTLRTENSFTAPAILQIDSTLFLAWTGTDANHSLNLLPITITGASLVPGTKMILSQFSSDAGPHLTSGGANSLVLSWTSRALQPKAAVANSPDLQFGLVATLPQTSAFAPDTLFISAVQGPPVWMSWTGTDTAHHLNLQFTTTYPAFPTAKTVLSDTAFGGPALALEQVAMAVPVMFPQLAWTGTDSAHHLNIAKIQM